MRHRDGSILTARLSLYRVGDAKGVLRHYEGFIENLTDMEALRSRLRASQEMAMRGQVAGGIAHDFNNILSATLIHLGLLLQDPGMSESSRDGLKMMQGEASRAAELTRQLLSFSRRREFAVLEPMEINKLIAAILKLLRHVARENILVVFLPAEEECWIGADAGLIEMLMMHICLLSRGGLSHGGTLTLATNLVPPADNSETAVCLSVKLAGPAVVGKSGDPVVPFGFLSERKDELTLDSINEIVALHHGRLDMPGRIERNPSFRISFPALEPSAAESAAVAEPEAVRGGSETILLVEDERYLRRVSTLCLRKLGYAVLEAGDDEEALRMWEKHRQKIDMLLTDFLLPGTNTGLELARRMEQEKPSLKIMIASGQGADFEEAVAAKGEGIMHLCKPYTTSELAAAMRKCLDKPVVSAHQT